MKAVTWQGRRNVSVENVPDPRIEEPTDAIIRVTSTGLCGSDLHLYDVMGPFLAAGDVLGHEPMGIVEEVGAEVSHVKAGDRAGDDDPLGVEGFATDRLALEEARAAYEAFQKKSDATFKVVFRPSGG